MAKNSFAWKTGSFERGQREAFCNKRKRITKMFQQSSPQKYFKISGGGGGGGIGVA